LASASGSIRLGRIPVSGARRRAEEGSLRDLTPQAREGAV